MKKFIALILIVATMFTVAACGGAKKSGKTYKLGETVSTDIVDMTIDNAEFAHYLSATMNDGYLEPIEETNTMYTAKTGKCYVSLTFTITNNDRAGHLDFGGTFSDWEPQFKVNYKNKNYDVYGFDLNSDDAKFSLYPSCTINKETGDAKKHDSVNYLIDAGETVTFRTFGIINVDPGSLKDGFELSLQVPDSKGEFKTFTYSIPAK